jgi:hypothetical protein
VRFRTSGPPPVFLVGWFRSGTTFAWNLLRQDPGNVCFCEPFHEDLLELVRVGAPPHTDRTHTDVEDYWREYRALDPGRLGELWAPWFGRERFRLGATDDAADLYDYVSFLASQGRQRAVLKFVRANLRAPWLRARFPDSWIVHVTRAPRDVWTSAVGRGSRRIDANPAPDPYWGSFPAYFSTIAADIGLRVPGHPYRQFYALWSVGEQHVASVADDTWRYEEMVTNFDRWASLHLLAPGLTESVPALTVRRDSIGAQFHSDAWYNEREAEVDALLARRRRHPLTDLTESHTQIAPDAAPPAAARLSAGGG